MEGTEKRAALVEITSPAQRESTEDAEHSRYLAQAAAVMEAVEAALAEGAVLVAEIRRWGPGNGGVEPRYAAACGLGGIQGLLESASSLKNGIDWLADPGTGDLVAVARGAMRPGSDATVAIREVADAACRELVLDAVGNAGSTAEVEKAARNAFSSCARSSAIAASAQRAAAAAA